MAWIPKNSGTRKIDHRDEPYLSTALKSRLESEVLPRYATRLAALLPVLHELQEHVGWLPMQALIEAADFLGVPPATVLDTVTFYEEFRLRPVGKHVIGVCQSISCECCGHIAVLDRLRERLGVDPGETTPDGRFTLRTMECLGACDTAPCALVNEDRLDLLTPAQVDALIDRLRSQSPPKSAPTQS